MSKMNSVDRLSNNMLILCNWLSFDTEMWMVDVDTITSQHYLLVLPGHAIFFTPPPLVEFVFSMASGFFLKELKEQSSSFWMPNCSQAIKIEAIKDHKVIKHMYKYHIGLENYSYKPCSFIQALNFAWYDTSFAPDCASVFSQYTLVFNNI